MKKIILFFIFYFLFTSFYGIEKETKSNQLINKNQKLMNGSVDTSTIQWLNTRNSGIALLSIGSSLSLWVIPYTMILVDLPNIIDNYYSQPYVNAFIPTGAAIIATGILTAATGGLLLIISLFIKKKRYGLKSYSHINFSFNIQIKFNDIERSTI